MNSKERKPWKVLSSKVITDNRWFPVRADTVEVSNGKVMEDFVIASPNDWSSVVALTPNSEVVLVRQYRHGIGQTTLELPSGGIEIQDGVDRQEAALQAAKRELLEETGFASDDMVYLGSLSGNPVRYTNRAYLFLAQNVQEIASQALDEMEDIEVVLLPFETVVTKALSGEMQHPHHMAALLLALGHLGNLNI